MYRVPRISTYLLALLMLSALMTTDARSQRRIGNTSRYAGPKAYILVFALPRLFQLYSLRSPLRSSLELTFPFVASGGLKSTRVYKTIDAY